jgi:Protein of unknown function (DUF4231)
MLGSNCVTEPEHDYIKETLEDQIKWHSGKARENKKKFHMLQIIIIITSTSVPVVNTVSPTGYWLRITWLNIVIVTSLLQLHKYQENWIIYRTTAELLKKEKYLYLNSAGDYSGLGLDERKKSLVERVELIVSSETSKYFTIRKPERPSQICGGEVHQSGVVDAGKND